MLEGIEAHGHQDTLLLALHEFAQFPGHGNRLAHGVAHRVEELGRVGRFETDTDFAGLQPVDQRLITTGPVGIEQILLVPEGIVHSAT